MAGPSKGPERHRREKTPHPTSSLGHLLPKGEGEGFPTLSRGERVAAMRRRVRGLVPGPHSGTVKLRLPPRQSRGISQRIRHDARGCTLDVLNVVRALNKDVFSLRDVYAFAAHLEKLHPDNRHGRDKIRQQLQVLRDLGFVEFLDRGHYRNL